MATKRAKKSREGKRPSARVIPFPVVPRRGAEIAAKLPFSVVPTRNAPANTAAPKPASADERPAAGPTARPWKWWEIGLVASVALHVAAAAVFQAKYAYELERAAGAAAASAEGTNVIPIEVLVTAALPAAPAPTDATAREATKPAETTPKETSDEKREKTAPPPKDEAATEMLPIAKETPQP